MPGRIAAAASRLLIGHQALVRGHRTGASPAECLAPGARGLEEHGMGGVMTGLLVFAFLAGAALIVLWLHPRLPSPHRSKETTDIV